MLSRLHHYKDAITPCCTLHILQPTDKGYNLSIGETSARVICVLRTLIEPDFGWDKLYDFLIDFCFIWVFTALLSFEFNLTIPGLRAVYQMAIGIR